MRLALLLLALLLPLAALAAPEPALRELFRDLSATAQRGDLDQQSAAVAGLRDYPLFPYLLASDLRARLRRHADRTLDAEIADFVDSFPTLPPARGLRAAWLKSAGKRGRWDLVLAQVDDGDVASLRCLATTGAIRTQSRSSQALITEGLEYWLRGRSQPDACDPVFAWLEQTGALTEARVIERARLAVLAGQYGLAEYLARRLPSQARARIARWLNIARNPGDLHTVPSLDTEIAVYAFKRLALQDLDAAAALAPGLAARLSLPAPAVFQMRRYVALLYAQDHRPQALAWFDSLQDARMDDYARAWAVRAAVWHGQWQRVLDAIAAMTAEQAGAEEWRYWRARALAALGDADMAEDIFAQLARQRSYHGYLAADRLDLAYQMNRAALLPAPKARALLLKTPAVARARELLALARPLDARREWYVAIDDLPAGQLRQAALLAHDWGWHAMAIITLARGDYWDDLDIRYPLHYRELARANARAQRLDPAYVLAVMRTESLFMSEARSAAGAVGLMQLLPGTARRVASGLGLPRPGLADLRTPATNIRLGSGYLRQMLDRFDGHLALASAAYNAGPNRAQRWLPDAETSADVWIANIPYTETRKYVQRVMAHMTVFQDRLDGDISPLAERLPPVPSAAAIQSGVAAN